MLKHHDRPAVASRLLGVGQIDPTTLVEARLALHWSAQVVAAFGFTALPALEDFSHTTLHWIEGSRALVSGTHAPSRLSVALLLPEFALELRRGSDPLERFDLDGQRLDAAYHWLGEALGRAGLAPAGGVKRPEHLGEMPEHPAGQGGPLVAPPREAREALGRWFSVADALLRGLDVGVPTPVYGWPHHFDVALLHVIEGQGEAMRSVGVGLSPGDQSYAEPYVYVTPWPYPEAALPPLPAGGRWHTEGWTGAVLRASELVAASAAERGPALLDFVQAAHRFCVEQLSSQPNR